MKTLKEIIAGLKIRKGTAHGTNKHGAFWTISGDDFFARIRRTGGDGIGQSTPDVSYYLDFRHFRNGEISAMVYRDAWHQNGAYCGAGKTWQNVSEVLEAQTIEQVVVILKGIEIDGSPVCGSNPVDLIESLRKLGLPEAEPAPDEPNWAEVNNLICQAAFFTGGGFAFGTSWDSFSKESLYQFP